MERDGVKLHPGPILLFFRVERVGVANEPVTAYAESSYREYRR